MRYPLLIKFSLINLILFILISCEPGGEYNYYVDNKSIYTFNVLVKGAYYANFRDSNILISSQKRTKFYGLRERDHGDLETYFLKVAFDTVYIHSMDTTIKLDKDFQNRDEWDLSIIDHHNRNSTFDYTFVITNNDISSTNIK